MSNVIPILLDEDLSATCNEISQVAVLNIADLGIATVKEKIETAEYVTESLAFVTKSV